MEFLKKIARRIRSFLIFPLLERREVEVPNFDSASQILLKLSYQKLAESGAKLPRIRDVGFKVFSQTDEDGILLYIFSLIGEGSRKCVEICAGSGIECNSANLIIHHGWTGLLVDGDEAQVAKGKEFYRRHPSTFVFPPSSVHAWITRDNVNEIIRNAGFEGEVDMLSVDMDGVDYWIWQAITAVTPRVVVVEYNDIIGPVRSLTVPYADDFNARQFPTTDGVPNFCGASLRAFVNLAKVKGYRLVGCNRYGYNAFFVRNDLGVETLPEVAIECCFEHPKVFQGMRERFPTVQSLPWVEV